jgi:hypothetical protein
VLRGVGIGLGVAGGALLVAAGGLGLAAISARDDLPRDCFPATVCNERGADTAARGGTFATLSTIGAIGGGALLAGGLALFFLNPRPRRTTVALTPDGAIVRGTF